MEGKEFVVVETEGKVEELEFGRRTTMGNRGMEGKKKQSRSKSAPCEFKFPGAPAWEPAGAGREAGRAPEPTGLGTGQGRAGGRGSTRADRPVCRPGPGVRPEGHPSQPAWAGSEAGPRPGTPSFLCLHPSLLVLISLTSEHFVSLEIP